MKGFFYGIYVQFKIDLRNKEILLFYYLVPLLFYLFVGSFFISLMEGFQEQMIISMSVFGITMGGVLGSGMAICTHYGSVMRKAYQVGGIPFWVYLVQNLISSILHLLLMTTIIVFSAPFLFEAQMQTSYWQFYGIITCYIIICVLISSLLALCFQKINKMTMAAQCIFLPSILLSGMMVPTSVLNETFRFFSRLFPATWLFQWFEGFYLYAGICLCSILVLAGAIAIRLKQVQKKEMLE